jgi:hypothetical protein
MFAKVFYQLSKLRGERWQSEKDIEIEFKKLMAPQLLTE